MQSEDDESELIPPEGPAPPRSRTSEKREKVSNEEALAELVQGLRSLTAGQLANMGCSELVLDALRDSKQIKSYSALERHMRFTRGLLRGEDWQPLLRRLDLVRAGFSVDATEESGPAFEWTNALLIQGDPALRRFMEQFPETDRRRVRQLMQNVKRSSEMRRAKARRILETAVHNAIQHAALEARKKGATLGGPAFVSLGAASSSSGAAESRTPEFYAGLYDDDEGEEAATSVAANSESDDE